MTPGIGIVSGYDAERRAYALHSAYVLAVEAVGGLPVILPYPARQEDVASLVRLVDGVVLTGGSDFDPCLYGEPMHPAVENVIPARDRFEFNVATYVLQQDVPVLGICRGMQMLNIVGGGTLVPDILSCIPHALNHRDGSPLDAKVHAVSVSPHSRLAGMAGDGDLRVNSSHHQAVKRIGSGFEASAWSSDGIVEAIESRHHRFALGVQWHPEQLWHQDAMCRRVFEELVWACRLRRGEDRHSGRSV